MSLLNSVITQVLSLIESQELLNFFTTDIAIPSKMAPDYSSLIRADRLMEYWIIGTLSEEVLELAVGPKTVARGMEGLDQPL